MCLYIAFTAELCQAGGTQAVVIAGVNVVQLGLVQADGLVLASLDAAGFESSKSDGWDYFLTITGRMN